VKSRPTAKIAIRRRKTAHRLCRAAPRPAWREAQPGCYHGNSLEALRCEFFFEAILLHGMVKLEGARCCLCFVRLEACLTLLAGSAHMQLRLCARGQCPACGDCAFGLVRHGKASRRNPPSPLTLASGRLVGDFFAVPVCVCLFVLVRTSSEPVALPNATRPESSRGLAAGQIWSSAARVVGGGPPPAGVPDRKCVRFKQTHS